MVETRNFFFFFFPKVFSLKDDRLDIDHYYCYFAYVGIAEIEIFSESEVTGVMGAPHQYPDQRYCLKDGRCSIPITILSP